MPYIPQNLRTDWDNQLEDLIETTIHVNWTVGELNYMITKLLLSTKPLAYGEYNALIGVLECCKLEFYRRAVAAYEDEKIQQNGDVF